MTPPKFSHAQIRSKKNYEIANLKIILVLKKIRNINLKVFHPCIFFDSFKNDGLMIKIHLYDKNSSTIFEECVVKLYGTGKWQCNIVDKCFFSKTSLTFSTRKTSTQHAKTLWRDIFAFQKILYFYIVQILKILYFYIIFDFKFMYKIEFFILCFFNIQMFWKNRIFIYVPWFQFVYRIGIYENGSYKWLFWWEGIFTLEYKQVFYAFFDNWNLIRLMYMIPFFNLFCFYLFFISSYLIFYL